MKDFGIGDLVIVTYQFSNNYDVATVVEKIDDKSLKVRYSLNGKTKIVDIDRCYHYNTRVDMIYRKIPEVEEFIKRRFSDCKETFIRESYYFALIMKHRFPNMDIFYSYKNNNFLIGDHIVFYNIDGRYFPDDKEKLERYNYIYTNDRTTKEKIDKEYIL